MRTNELTAVLWDFGGVILSSPFEAFQRYESQHGMPPDFIRSVNATDPDHNAWARFERSEITAAEFDMAFADESERRGHRVPGMDVLGLLHGEIRPDMVEALDRVIAAGYRTACLTNNIAPGAANADPTGRSALIAEVMGRFHVVVESSKAGVRKPEPAFYTLACELLDVSPTECVFLDDLGINLKPARAMGMHTIKVLTPDQALADLSALLALPLR